MTLRLPEGARLDKGQGGQDCLFIDTPLCTAHIYLLGANVTHFQPKGQDPVLWLSPKSLFQPGKAIRGGIPICWPWFGPKADDPKAPQHGFVRTRAWTLDEVTRNADGSITARLGIKSSDETRAAWPFDFECQYSVTAGKALRAELTTINTGSKAFHLEEALHTYLQVKDVTKASVTGLADLTYIDKVDGAKRKHEGTAPVVLSGETDRVYLKTHGTCVVEDPQMRRRIHVKKSGSACTVVWNPWAEKVKGMGDMGEGSFATMICVEAANSAEHGVEVEPGTRHTVQTILETQSQ
jgi:D-hexose-6-phosphate mutarotase